MLVPAPIRELLDALWQEGRAHDADEPTRERRYRNLEPESGRLLGLLARSLGAERILELGTSTGVSTIWLAASAPLARVTTVERDEDRARIARANLERAGLAARVELRRADAAQVLAELYGTTYDLVFLDAERGEYERLWPALRPLLRPGGLLVVDNAVSHAHELVGFRRLLEDEPSLAAIELRVGAGLLLAHRDQPAAAIAVWLARYADAWRSADADAVAELFSEDACYRSQPFRQPHVGRDAIRSYWRRSASRQRDVDVRFGRPFVEGERAAVEWWAAMEDEDDGPTTLSGNLVLRFAADGRCRELRETWNLEPGGHEPFAGWGDVDAARGT